MRTEPFELIDGPLAGQIVQVTPGRGGRLPEAIYCHARLPADHVGEPRPRHQYVPVWTGYAHSDSCACISGTHGVRLDVDTPTTRG